MSGVFLLLVRRGEIPYLERLIRVDMDDIVSKTSRSVMVEVRMVLDCKEIINGGSYQKEALRKWCNFRCGSEAEVNVLLCHMMRCQRLRCMNGGDIVVVKGEYR